jgi:hypothetical protein
VPLTTRLWVSGRGTGTARPGTQCSSTRVRVPVNSPQVEVNPLSRRPLALGHSGSEVTSFAIKASAAREAETQTEMLAPERPGASGRRTVFACARQADRPGRVRPRSRSSAAPAAVARTGAADARECGLRLAARGGLRVPVLVAPAGHDQSTLEPALCGLDEPGPCPTSGCREQAPSASQASTCAGGARGLLSRLPLSQP